MLKSLCIKNKEISIIQITRGKLDNALRPMTRIPTSFQGITLACFNYCFIFFIKHKQNASIKSGKDAPSRDSHDLQRWKLQRLITPSKKMVTDKHDLRVSVSGMCIYLCFDFYRVDYTPRER